ncbi:FtsW/RodA/SpoVE family cell cycle protein [Clostridium sediminicola]|uniref:FtsW/RodA/SpoVE family cell cycle protein n=1 Tax=Clostridium sediminicola TaxID=3114879 RepID=UPI0031F1C511
MNKFISKFLQDVCTEVKYKKVHPALTNELKGHIDELIDEYIENGINKEEAAQKAIKQMGDPLEIGKKLNKTHKPKTEWSILALIVANVFIGTVTFLSIASTNTIATSTTSYLAYVIIGLVACISCYLFDYTKIEKYSLHIFITTICFLFFSQLSQTKVNGLPFLRIGPFSIMPATLVIPLFLISFAGLLNKWCTDSIKNMVKLIGIAFIGILTFLAIPSIANAIILCCGYLIMFTVALTTKNFKGNKKNYLLALYGSGISLVLLPLYFLVAFEPYRMNRLLAFINPNSDPNGSGYQYLMLNKLLSHSKFIGHNESLFMNINGSNHFTLPEMNTDFAFTYIISAFGWIAGAFVIIIFAVTIIRMFFATKKIHSSFGKYIASSIITVFSLQVFANILMNLGMFPIIGISLPFISYGGSNFITNMILLGLLLSVYRRKDLIIINSKA